MSDDLKIGQQLWFVPSQYSGKGCKFVTVKKVGREWVTIQYSNDQFDKSKLINGKAPLDGGRYSSPGYVYLSRDLHDQEVESRLLTRKIIAALEGEPFTVEQLKAIEKILEVKNA